jgi:UDP:flavonoid glycosyltransferase YjiC (YdhE family)
MINGSNMLGPTSDGDRAPLRVLFTTNGLNGHFQPLVPFARGLQAAGHTVAFATSPYFVPAIAAAGFRGFPIGSQPPPDVLRDTIGPAIAHLSPAAQISYLNFAQIDGDVRGCEQPRERRH